jgi:hypothetical protein
MRRLASVVALSFVSWLGAPACGGTVAHGTGASSTRGAGASGTGGTGASGTGTISRTVLPTGECTSDADCNGGQCVELTPGGYRECAFVPPEATTCGSGDACCTAADCPGGGKCYLTTNPNSCGLLVEPSNMCMADQCTDDASCSGGICIPAGTAGWAGRSCLPASCRVDADCTAHAGGACLPVVDLCCGLPTALACFYPGGCATNADCVALGGGCAPDPVTGIGTCTPSNCPL